VRVCLYIASCREDYNANVNFSLFPSPVELTKCLSMENFRKNYSPVYAKRGVFLGWGSC
jgi:hypothetical protein